MLLRSLISDGFMLIKLLSVLINSTIYLMKHFILIKFNKRIMNIHYVIKAIIYNKIYCNINLKKLTIISMLKFKNLVPIITKLETKLMFTY